MFLQLVQILPILSQNGWMTMLTALHLPGIIRTCQKRWIGNICIEFGCVIGLKIIVKRLAGKLNSFSLQLITYGNFIGVRIQSARNGCGIQFSDIRIRWALCCHYKWLVFKCKLFGIHHLLNRFPFQTFVTWHIDWHVFAVMQNPWNILPCHTWQSEIAKVHGHLTAVTTKTPSFSKQIPHWEDIIWSICNKRRNPAFFQESFGRIIGCDHGEKHS